MSKMRNGIINHDRGCDQNGGSSHDNIDDDSHDCCNGEEQISTTARQVLSFDEEEAIVRGHQQQQQYQITPSEVGTYTNSGTTIHRRRPNTNTTKRARQKLPQQEELHEEQHNGNGNGVNYYHKNNNHNTRYRRRKKGTAKRKNKTSYANIETIVWSCSAIILVFWGRMIWKKFVSNDTVVDVVPWLPHQYTELPVAAASRRRVLKMQPSNNRTITTHGNIIDYHHHYSYVVGKSDNHNKNNSKKKIVIPVEEDWKDVSMIHIVNTRFMQEQGYLKELGNARLLLFQTVCLPSMVHQSTQNFIWIIKTDPKLDPTILRKLQSMLLPYPNFYLVGSNNNYLIRSTVPIKQRPNSNGTSTTTTTHPNNIDEYYDIDEDDFDDEDPKVGIAWRDGGEGYDLLQSKIYSGNLTHLYQAMALRHRLPILETRLDADDGLHQQYLQYVQSVAYQRFFTTRKRRQRQRRRRADQEDDKDDPEGREEEEVGKKNTVKEKEDDEVEGSVDDGDDDDSDSVPTTITTTNVKWLYWCARRHMEWHISVNQTSSSSKHNKKTNKKNNEVTATGEESSIASRIDAIGGGGTKTPEDDKFPMGILNPVEHSKLCITPGMTVGYNVGVDPKTVPVHPHDVLYRELVDSHDCIDSSLEDSHYDDDQKESSSSSTCLELVEDLLFCAIRSRTLTSAGMRHVLLERKYVPKEELREKFWQLAYLRFRLNMTEAISTRRYLLDHVADIATENLHGQCTTGHSCKQQAQQDLEAYVEVGKTGKK